MFRKTDPETIAPYLKYASNFFEGQASEVIIPETRDELIAFLRENKNPVTLGEEAVVHGESSPSA